MECKPPSPNLKEKHSMKDDLVDILSLTTMCLVSVFVIKMLAVAKGGVMVKKIATLGKLIKALTMTGT